MRSVSSVPAVVEMRKGKRRRSRAVLSLRSASATLRLRVMSGSAKSSRVLPRTTAFGTRATVFAERGVSVSRRSEGVSSNDSSSAPAAAPRMKLSNARRRSSGVRLSIVWRITVSLMPVKAKSVVRSSVPSGESVPSEAIFIRLSRTGCTGEVRRGSPSGWATR